MRNGANMVADLSDNPEEQWRCGEEEGAHCRSVLPLERRGSTETPLQRLEQSCTPSTIGLMRAYPLKQKDHTAFTIRDDWLPFVEKQEECVVKRIRTDRGAEQANRTILETARALLIESGVGNSMWPHAVRHATVARNRVLTKVGDYSWVPLKRWLGRKPPVTMQLDLTPSVWEEGEEAAAEDGDGEKVQEAPAGGGYDVETSGSTREATGFEGGEQQQGKAKVPELPQRRKLKGVVMKGWDTLVSRPGRTRMATMKLTAGADVAKQQLGNEEALLTLPHSYVPDEEDEPTYCFLAPAQEEPASIKEALAGPDRETWLVSRDVEFQSLLENGTWDLVVLPEGKKSVQCKWVPEGTGHHLQE
ncbi:unnamed protein product [Closterium sp. NIES-54]